MSTENPISLASVILFLDVDGVLNNTTSESGWFDSFNMQNLKRICETLNGPTIVLSSDWRRTPKNLEEVRRQLATFILTDVRERKSEIALWLKGKSFSKAFILHDMPAEFVDPEIENVKFIKIDNTLGLTEESVDLINALHSNN